MEGAMRPIIRIDSLDDPRVALYRNLKDRELDRSGKFFIAEGEYIVRRLLESDFPVESVLLADRRVEEIAPLVPDQIPVYAVRAEQMQRILGMKFHSGVIACGKRKLSMGLDDVLPAPVRAPQRMLLVILPDISNVENLGALIRISAGFGADAIILGERCHDPFWRQSIRVSMGTIFRLPLVQSQDILRDMARLKTEWKVELIATVLDPSAEPLTEARSAPRMGILFGGEAQGLSHELIETCDRRVTIPMKLGTDSLNVSVAAGIVLYRFTL
jgi:tRNA G18 (ribose-2'-O)-methylase SpoU